MKPKIGEIWNWRQDDSGCDETYGPGLVLGYHEGYTGFQEEFITFQFAEKGVFNLPLEMVHRFMHKSQSKS